MIKSRTLIFNIVLLLVVGLLILDYRYNPQLLRGECVSAHTVSDKIGQGYIIDCISCHTISSRNNGEQLIGYISIIVPQKHTPQQEIQQDNPYYSSNNRIKKQFFYLANVFSQKGCSYYQCSALHVLQDFKMSSQTYKEVIDRYNITLQNDIIFRITNNASHSLSNPLELASNLIIRKQLGSLVIRVRYSISQKVQQDQSPSVFFYQLNTTIQARFMLILVVILLSLEELQDLASHFKGFFKVLIYLLLSIAFIQEKTAIISSTVAIYLTIGKIYQLEKYGILLALLFLVSGFTIAFPFVAIFIILYTISVSAKQLIIHFSLEELSTFIGILCTTIYMWNAQWKFYIYLTPLLYLGALLSIQKQKTSKDTTKDHQIIPDEKDKLSEIEMKNYD